MVLSIPWKRAGIDALSVGFVCAWPFVQRGGFGQLRYPGWLRGLGWLRLVVSG